MVNISSVGLSDIEQRYVPYVHIDWFPGTPIARVEGMNDEHMTYRIIKVFLCKGTISTKDQIGHDPPTFGNGSEDILLVRFFDEHDQPIQIPDPVFDMFFYWAPNPCTETAMNCSAGSQTDFSIDNGVYTVYTSGLELGYQDTIELNVDISTAKTIIKKVKFAHSFTNLTSGASYNGTTIGAPSNFDAYNGVSWDETGPEVIHSIAKLAQGDITASLINLSADLNVFILSEPDPNSCISYGDYTTEYLNAPAGTYYIVADGFDGASGSYTLTTTYKGRKVLPGVLMLLLGD